MLKKLILRFAIAFALLFPVLMLIGLANGLSFRMSRLSLGRRDLKHAMEEYTKTGKVEAFGSKGPYLFTNQVDVSGVTYQGLVAVPVEACSGTLVLTTNLITFWLQTNQPPKIIPASGYRPPFFSNGL